MTHELCGEINNTKSYHLKIEDNQRNVKAEAALILIVMSQAMKSWVQWVTGAMHEP